LGVPEKKPKPKKKKLTLALDADRLGMTAGVFAATVVVFICLWWRHMDFAEVLFRAVIAFGFIYLVVFVLVKLFLRTTLTEFLTQKKGQRGRAKELGEGGLEPEESETTSGESE